MIDHEIISVAQQHIQKKFNEKISTSCPYVWLVEDVLDGSLLEKLTEFIQSDDLNWNKVQLQEYTSRRSISWLADSVIEETHTIFESLTPLIEKQLGRTQTFGGINIWKDQYPYIIKKHADQPKIGSAIQIYLNDAPIDLATRFEWQSQTLQPKNQKNCGYFMDNRGKVVHWLENPVPKNFTRLSLYAFWQD